MIAILLNLIVKQFFRFNYILQFKVHKQPSLKNPYCILQFGFYDKIFCLQL
jgi:hypothetical protein